MWFHRKNTVPAYTPPSSAPTSHRRIPAVADTTLRDLVLADADRLDASAADADARADQLLADAAKWRVLAAQYRRFAAQYDTPQPAPQPQREPAYDEPQPPADPAQFTATWTMPPSFIEQALAETPPLDQIHTSLWSPHAEVSPSGSTATSPLVNGWTR